MREYLNPQGACPAQGLYSHVTVASAGRTYYIAGQLAVGARGEVVGKRDAEAQIRQVFANMGDVLKGLGLSYRNVAKFTTYLVHSQDIEVFMRVREEMFPALFQGNAFPPNTLLVVQRLVKEDFLFEMEAIAVASDKG